jgi:hypothetical protein
MLATALYQGNHDNHKLWNIASFERYLFHMQFQLGTNCTLLLADLSLYSYEAAFMQGPLKKKRKKLARPLIFSV